jgi:sarcosine oxidase subunit alpha
MRLSEKTSTLPPYQRGNRIAVVVNGRKVEAFEGEFVSTVLHAEGISVFARKLTTGRASGIYCGMGICYECLVTIDGINNIRACQTFVVDQMIIETSQGNP